MITYWILERFIILLRINFIFNFIKCFCSKRFCYKKKDKIIKKENVLNDLGYGQWIDIEDYN